MISRHCCCYVTSCAARAVHVEAVCQPSTANGLYFWLQVKTSETLEQLAEGERYPDTASALMATMTHITDT